MHGLPELEGDEVDERDTLTVTLAERDGKADWLMLAEREFDAEELTLALASTEPLPAPGVVLRDATREGVDSAETDGAFWDGLLTAVGDSDGDAAPVGLRVPDAAALALATTEPERDADLVTDGLPERDASADGDTETVTDADSDAHSEVDVVPLRVAWLETAPLLDAEKDATTLAVLEGDSERKLAVAPPEGVARVDGDVDGDELRDADALSEGTGVRDEDPLGDAERDTESVWMIVVGGVPDTTGEPVAVSEADAVPTGGVADTVMLADAESERVRAGVRESDTVCELSADDDIEAVAESDTESTPLEVTQPVADSGAEALRGALGVRSGDAVGDA